MALIKKKVSIFLFIVSIVVLIIGIINIYKGFEVKDNYYNSDYSTLNTNAYVGGDAYNYIINGTYFTAYSTIGMGCFVISAITCVGGIFLYIGSTENTHKEDIQTADKLPEL